MVEKSKIILFVLNKLYYVEHNNEKGSNVGLCEQIGSTLENTRGTFYPPTLCKLLG